MTEPQPGGEPLRRWDPEQIGPYAILGRLGSGAMGQVYLGRSSAGRLVAVKTIKVELAEEAGFRTRFAQEVAAARRVSGFFTAAVAEADPDADLPWLATAYVPAPSLARLVAACGPLPAGSVRWLAAGCAEALESIHGAGLVHRDLKPSNVLVAPDGPRVIDFGVARAAERMGMTTSRGAVGTPAYMAPEQARDTHQASAASDVYALGATLLFAATGHPPYQGSSALDVLARLATEEPDLSGLPDELTELITACLQRVPRERPTSPVMLARLGPFTETRPGGHSYLPEEAMALIAQYQANPLLAAGRPDADDIADATSASYTELPASYQPKPRSQAPRRPPAGWRAWVRTHLAWVGWVSVGAALVVGGVILGASLTSSGSPPPGPPLAPQTVCGSQDVASHTLCMNQSQGGPAADFIVEGQDFPPGQPVVVMLSEVGPPPQNKPLVRMTSTFKPVTTAKGTFKVLVSQLYAGSLPPGLFTVQVTASGGSQAQTQFMVLPADAPAGAPPGP
ncbi:MAG TPA: serine/threonine-protein kinase [Streptosporangiaceae bacterium]|nr:serine/threonine-protein kinase [Streptosporangiaceae bacterium]